MAKGKWTQLHGQMYLNRTTGDVVSRYGGWHDMKLGNIKGTKAWKLFKETYGTKKGKVMRKKIALAVIRSLKISAPKV